ncbi:MAG: flippase [Clostridia bacterium]
MKKMIKNLFYNIFYQILVILLPLVTAPYISRVLGANNVGIYSYTYSIAYYFVLIAMLGISNYGNRTIASSRDDKKKMSELFWEIYSIQFLMYILAIILYTIYAMFINKDNSLITWIQIIYVVSGLLDITWLFFGLEQFKITVTRNTIIKLITVALIFLLVKNSNDLWIYTLIMSIGTLVSQLYLWFKVNKYVSYEKVKTLHLKKHIKSIIILFIPVIAYSIYKVMDKIMLGNLSSYNQVGFYQSCEKIINIPMGIITAIGTVMMPRMSNILSNGEREKMKDYIRISIEFVTIIGSAITFGIMGTCKILAPVYFGKEFYPCYSILFLLSLTIFSLSWANVARTQVLIPQKKDKVYVFSTIIGAIVNLIINLVSIPKWGANGASIGTILAELVVMIIQVYFVNKSIPIIKNILSTIPFIIIGFVMMIIVYFIGVKLETNILTLIIQIISGGSFYIIFTFIYLNITNNELLNMLKNMNKKN